MSRALNLARSLTGACAISPGTFFFIPCLTKVESTLWHNVVGHLPSCVSPGILLVVAWSLSTSQGHDSLRHEGGGRVRIFQQWFGCRCGRIVCVFGVVGFALAFQSVVAVQLLLLPVSLFRRFYCCGVNLLVFAQQVYACCEVVCTFFLHAQQFIAHTIFVCCVYGRLLLDAAEFMGKWFSLGFVQRFFRPCSCLPRHSRSSDGSYVRHCGPAASHRVPA